MDRQLDPEFLQNLLAEGTRTLPTSKREVRDTLKEHSGSVAKANFKRPQDSDSAHVLLPARMIHVLLLVLNLLASV